MAKPPLAIAEPQNALNAEVSPFSRIMLVGPTGSGKSTQIWSLPGRKFVYVFDPNTMATISGCDADYVPFLPEFTEMDATLKGFNKGAVSDMPRGGKREPSLYMRWVDHINDFEGRKLFERYDWLVFDSMTFIAKALMDRQLYINNRYGDIEELGDYRVVGSKLADVFGTISSLPINIYSTGHIQTYEDDKTKKVVTQIMLPGKGRTMLPLSHTDTWEARAGEKAGTYEVKTVPESRGLQEIRSAMKGLKPVEDVTIRNFKRASEFGIGALIARSQLNGKSNQGGAATRT
jgi:GTPase SAR1 family protein